MVICSQAAANTYFVHHVLSHSVWDYDDHVELHERRYGVSWLLDLA